MGMHAFGQTLWRVGELRVLALPGAAGHDTYCVAVGSKPLGTFPSLERALAFFDALRGTSDERAAETAADAWSQRAERQRVLLKGQDVDPPALGHVTDLAGYRRRRASRRGPPGIHPTER